MAEKKTVHYPVDEWIRALTPEQIAQVLSAFRGEAVKIIEDPNGTLRTTCGVCSDTKEQAKRVLAIDPNHPGRRAYCHGECKQGGNFMWLLARESGEISAKGKVFIQIAQKFRKALDGIGIDDETSTNPNPVAPTLQKLVNVPMAQSENERARALVNLHEKLTADTTAMPKLVAQRARRIPNHQETCNRFEMGYLTKDTGGENRAGGTLRGTFVFPYHNTDGEKLCYFGWDHEYDQKHQDWQVQHGTWQNLKQNAAKHGKPFAAKEPREPMEYRFVKGFHYGVELWGQHLLTNPSPEIQQHIQELGIFLVQHPFDAVALLARDYPALATCSPAISREQAVLAAELARGKDGRGIVNLVHDCTPEGEDKVRQAIGLLAQAAPVHLPVTRTTHGAKYQQKRVNDLVGDPWTDIIKQLRNGASPWVVA